MLGNTAIIAVLLLCNVVWIGVGGAIGWHGGKAGLKIVPTIFLAGCVAGPALPILALALGTAALLLFGCSHAPGGCVSTHALEAFVTMLMYLYVLPGVVITVVVLVGVGVGAIAGVLAYRRATRWTGVG